jgi:hypothetical protein
VRVCCAGGVGKTWSFASPFVHGSRNLVASGTTIGAGHWWGLARPRMSGVVIRKTRLNIQRGRTEEHTLSHVCLFFEGEQGMGEAESSEGKNDSEIIEGARKVEEYFNKQDKEIKKQKRAKQAKVFFAGVCWIVSLFWPMYFFMKPLMEVAHHYLVLVACLIIGSPSCYLVHKTLKRWEADETSFKREATLASLLASFCILVGFSVYGYGPVYEQLKLLTLFPLSVGTYFLLIIACIFLVVFLPFVIACKLTGRDWKDESPNNMLFAQIFILGMPVLAFILIMLAGDYQRHQVHSSSEGGQLNEEELNELGETEAAKNIYLEAAKLGSAEAHFSLAYKFVVSRPKAIYHFSEAAKKGHPKALAGALDALLFRANSLNLADPKRALNLYYIAKKANPKLTLYDEKIILKVMKMCSEPKEFDAAKFIEKYDLPDNIDRNPYYVWEFAEEASRGGRFGEPDPELVFNLVMRGGWAPAEFVSAVMATYENWKNRVVEKFDICDHVTSHSGSIYCTSRRNLK